jgi:hypothetical protein
VDYYSQKPINNIKVTLMGAGVMGSTAIATTMTGQSGYFHLQYDGRSELYSVGVDDYGMNQLPLDSSNMKDIKSGETYNLILYTRQQGRFILKVKNLTPINANDHLRLLSFFYLPKNDFYGTSVDTSFYFPAVSGTKNSVKYEVTKNGTTSSPSFLYVDVPPDSIPLLELDY